MATLPESGPDRDRLARYALIAQLLDQAFRVPGTRWRFGLDAIVGLVPGAGDVLTSLVGAYGIWIARELGAPTAVQTRMLLNLTIDALVGAIPILGDLFDVAFKAHVRNRVLLEEWLARPGRTRRSSALGMAAILLALLVMAAGGIWIAVIAVRWLYGALTT